MRTPLLRVAYSLILLLGTALAGVGAQSVAAHADATGTGGDFVSVPYFRLFDTTVTGTPFGGGETRAYTILGSGSIPASGVGAVVIDVSAWTATAPSTNPTMITVFPCGQARPSAPVVTADASNVPRSNTVVVAPGSSGQICILTALGRPT